MGIILDRMFAYEHWCWHESFLSLSALLLFVFTRYVVQDDGEVN